MTEPGVPQRGVTQPDMSQPNGHVQPIAGAPREQPPSWRPETMPDPGTPAHRGPDAPALVLTAAIVSIAFGVLLAAAALSTMTAGVGVLPTLVKVVFPAVMVLGGVGALRGRRGLLTTGAVYLLVTGVVLMMELLGSDRYDSTPALIEGAVRLVSGTLIIVFGRVSSSSAFFDAEEERRYGRKEADFFR